MKGLLTALLFIGLFVAADTIKATNYYFSSSSGDDSRTTTQARDPTTPWKTLNKLNSFFGNLRSGDSVLFNRGDIFYGSISISKSGSSLFPIVLGSYGSGAKPIITGFTTVSSWTSVGGGIYESVISSGLSSLKMVTFNGAFQAVGRWPKLSAANAGWLTSQSHSGNSSITSNAISGALNYTGGEVVIRKNHWVIDRGIISNQTSTTVAYSGTSGYDPQNGNGFFFQNHINACTALGDWCYDPSTKKIKMYFGGNSPSSYTIQASTINDVVTMSSKSYITFDNISVIGANSTLVSLGGSSNHITINACDFLYGGITGISSGSSATYITITNSTISYINSNATNLGFGAVSNITIQNNVVTQCAMVAGMGQNGDGDGFGISVAADNSIVENNEIGFMGYKGIFFVGTNITIQNNYVHDFCQVKDDGGGIYTSDSKIPGRNGINKKILNNIVINGGSTTVGYGTLDNLPSSYGIYADEAASYITISGNTAANCLGGGIHTNSGTNLQITNNTFFDNTIGFAFSEYNISLPLSNVAMSNNIFFAKTANQLVGSYFNYLNSLIGLHIWGTWDNNYYCRPISELQGITANSCYLTGCTKGIIQLGNMQSGTIKDYSLDKWRAISSQDAHSKKSPKIVSNINDIRFEYNSTPSDKVVNLGANYIGVDSTIYSGKITLAPFTSKVLIYLSGTIVNQAPVAIAGSDQNFFLPINATSLIGTASDVDGTITSYQWAKISGPAQFTIVSPNEAQTAINNMVQGTYQFELKVTDNLGAVGKDTIVITVNAAANQPPVANAGNDQSITLPTNSVTITGIGTDADGTINSYQWSKISGPTQFTLVSPSLDQTVINNMMQGVYQFELKVTDNFGDSGKDTITITVNASTLNNHPPIANAGLDINMTLPTNNVLISGSGSDIDGAIISYQWTKISGPTQFNIVSPTQAHTAINNLVQGVYQFELKVTDNFGNSGKDTVFVTVNLAASNQLSTTNSALNITIGESINKIEVYPNPATNIVYIKIVPALQSNLQNSIPLNQISTNICIYNSVGSIIHFEKILIPHQTMIKVIDVSNYPAGIYFITMSDPKLGSNNHLKLIKQ